MDKPVKGDVVVIPYPALFSLPTTYPTESKKFFTIRNPSGVSTDSG